MNWKAIHSGVRQICFDHNFRIGWSGTHNDKRPDGSRRLSYLPALDLDADWWAGPLHANTKRAIIRKVTKLLNDLEVDGRPYFTVTRTYGCKVDKLHIVIGETHE